MNIYDIVAPVELNIDSFKEPLPVSFQLKNYPNPFNSSTMIQFHITNRMNIKLEIFSITGKLIKSIINKELNEGIYRLAWDGTDNQYSDVASGIYICKITSDFHCEGKRLLLIR